MMITVEHVSFAYLDRQVLRDVSFSVPANEVWALVGRSGVGKTTLLHIISGLYAPQEGRVLVEGRGNGPGRIRGVVFQEEALLGWLTAEGNLLFPRYRGHEMAAQTAARKLLAAVGLDTRANAYPHEFSVGMRRRLEFARALIADDQYILADEPFASVDAVTRSELWDLWRDLRRRERRTGLVCTHDPQEAIRLCDAVIVLDSGSTGTYLHLVEVPDSVRSLGASEVSDELRGLERRIINMVSGHRNEP